MISLKFSQAQISAIIIAFCLGLAKITGFLRDATIVHLFGINFATDLFFLSLVLPIFFSTLFASSFNLFFIPSYQKFKHLNGPDFAQKYFFALFFYSFIFLVLVSILYINFLSWKLLNSSHLFLEFKSQLEYFRIISNWAAAFLLFSSLTSLFSSLLQSEHRYFAAIFPLAIMPTMSILFLLTKHSTFGVSTALYGSTLGAFFCLLFHSIYCYHLGYFKIFKIHSIPISSLLENWPQFLILCSTYTLPGLTAIIDRKIALSMGEGKVSTLNYGLSLTDGLYEIISVGIGMAVFVYFSEWVAKNKHSQIVELVQKVFIFSIFFLLPICFFLYIFATPLLSSLYLHGALTPQSISDIATVQRCYSPAIVLTVLIIVGQRIISAHHINHILLILSLLAFSIKIILNHLFCSWWGIIGLPLATNTTFTVTIICTYFFLHKLGYSLFTPTLNKFIFPGILVNLTIFFILSGVHGAGLHLPFMLQSLCGTLAITIFLSITYLIMHNKLWKLL